MPILIFRCLKVGNIRMDGGSDKLKKTLTFQDLILFGVPSIMGSGGFNLIGDGIVTGGQYFSFAIAFVSLIFQGTSYVYQQIYNEFKTNTAESDMIRKEFGSAASNLSNVTILLFNLISVSLVLVICSKLLFPTGTWTGQISFALSLLAGMTATALQGIEFDRDIITLSGFAIVCLMCFTTLIGVIEVRDGFPTKMPASTQTNIPKSIMYFFFVLAGFDALIKFTKEVKDPDRDLPRSFYASNAISTLLTVGMSLSFLVTFQNRQFKENDNIIAKIVGAMLGPSAEQFIGLLSIALMIMTAFVCYLASTRFMYGLGEQIDVLSSLKELNVSAAPWKAIVIATVIISIGILFNHIYELVKFCNVALITTLLVVTAAVTKHTVSKGIDIPWIEGLTTLGLGGLLSTALFYD